MGQDVGSELIEGTGYSVWPRGSVIQQQTVQFWIKAWQGIGGASTNTPTAMKYLLKQMEELASNRDQQPVYIQWTASADPTAALNASEIHDGWYVIDEFAPDYRNNVVTGLVQARLTVSAIAPQSPRRVSISYSGGALSTSYSGTATNLISSAIASTTTETSINRTAAQGNVPSVLSPVDSPESVSLSSTVSNFFQGAVEVYDTINTSNNAVPTSGGTYVNANWVKVYDTNHDFTGDCVLTNGLQLLLFQTGQARVAQCYLWNTASGTQANWQNYAALLYQDNAGNSGTLKQYSLTRVGGEESSLRAVLSTSGGKVAQVGVRLQRGRYEARADFMPRIEASTTNTSLALQLVATPKIIYNSGKVADVVLSETSPTTAADYGYGTAFVASTAQPFLAGFLYQNPPGGSQPYDAGNSATVGLGDTTSLSAQAQRSYGFFAVPYGVSGTYSTANLQGEAESGSTSGSAGWASTSDGSASASSAEKLASGSASGAILTFGTAFTPNAGAGRAWFRLKVASTASTVAQFKFGYYDTTASAYVASTTVAPSALATSYAWYAASTSFTPTAAHNMQFRCESTTTTTTDITVDEAVFTPQTLTTDNRGPQELWQQFSYDRSVRLVRP